MSCDVNVDLHNSFEDDGVHFKLTKLSLLIFFMMVIGKKCSDQLKLNMIY